jgi:hypothetical protein
LQTELFFALLVAARLGYEFGGVKWEGLSVDLVGAQPAARREEDREMIYPIRTSAGELTTVPAPLHPLPPPFWMLARFSHSGKNVLDLEFKAAAMAGLSVDRDDPEHEHGIVYTSRADAEKVAPIFESLLPRGEAVVVIESGEM